MNRVRIASLAALTAGAVAGAALGAVALGGSASSSRSAASLPGFRGATFLSHVLDVLEPSKK